MNYLIEIENINLCDVDFSNDVLELFDSFGYREIEKRREASTYHSLLTVLIFIMLKSHGEWPS